MNRIGQTYSPIQVSDRALRGSMAEAVATGEIIRTFDECRSRFISPQGTRDRCMAALDSQLGLPDHRRQHLREWIEDITKESRK